MVIKKGPKQPEEAFQIMVMLANPDDFVSWPDAQKIKFYRQAVAWHSYIEGLKKQGYVEQAWGTQTFPGMAVNPGKILLIALYKTSFDKFSELIVEDPLWNYAIYQAPALLPITHEFAKNDYDDDLKSFHQLKARVEGQLGKKLPEPAVRFLDSDKIPTVAPGGKLQFMVTFQNTDGYADLPDVEKLRQDERVLEMHQYHAILRERGIIVQEWGCYQNFGFRLEGGAPTKSGRHIYEVNTLNEFDALLLLDPQRAVSKLRTLMLLPFEESLKRTKAELKSARRELRK